MTESASDILAQIPDTDSDQSSSAIQKQNADILSAFDDHPHVAPVTHHTALTAAPVVRAAPTQFQKAVQPQPEQSWGDTFSSALHNLPGSLGGVLQATGHALIHPIETATNLGQLGKGAFSQAAGALGIQQDPAQKAKDEELLNALEQHYSQVYGSKAGFKKALATDPASIAMDAATLLGGAELTAPGKIAALAGKAASILDPVQASLGIAKTVGKLPSAMIRGSQSAMSAAPYSTLQIAAKAGATSDPLSREAFLSQYTGRVPQSQIANEMMDGLQQIKANNAAKFATTKEGIYAANPGTLGFGKVDQKVADAQQAMNPAGIPSPAAFLPKTKDALEEAVSLVDHWKQHPELQTMEGFDQLRNGIGDIMERGGNNSFLRKYVGGIYHGIRETMQDISPEYTNVLEETTEARRVVEDLQKTLGLGRNSAATATVAKALRNMGKVNGMDLLNQLATVKPQLPYMLAGAALNPWRPGGLIGHLEGTGAAAGVGYALAHPAALPATLATAAGTAFMSSPKIAGASNYAAGKVGSVIGKARGPMTAGYYGERAGESSEPSFDGAVSSGDPVFDRILKQESGGHQFRADGTPMISPAGAIGAAQIMPQTGPEAAAAAGEPWSLDRLKNDPAYNIKLGRAYFHKLLGEFNGDVSKAVAAYNTGPGNVKKALARAGADDWVHHLPFAETRNYVTSIMNDLPEYAANGGRIERASGGKVGHQHLVDRLMKLANKAKRDVDQASKPLLQADDSSVAHALAIANRGI